jgi:hypothetical protein
MERIKTLLVSLGLIISITLLVKSFLMPEIWWLYLIPVIIIGFRLRKRVRYSFFVGFLSGFLAYLLLILLLRDAHLDLTRISSLMLGGTTPTILKLITCFLGGLLTGLAFHSGKYLPINKK